MFFHCRYSQVYTDLHSTISNTDADKDLKWWSDNHGADMPMAWPVFEVQLDIIVLYLSLAPYLDGRVTSTAS